MRLREKPMGQDITHAGDNFELVIVCSLSHLPLGSRLEDLKLPHATPASRLESVHLVHCVAGTTVVLRISRACQAGEVEVYAERNEAGCNVLESGLAGVATRTFEFAKQKGVIV